MNGRAEEDKKMDEFICVDDCARWLRLLCVSAVHATCTCNIISWRWVLCFALLVSTYYNMCWHTRVAFAGVCQWTFWISCESVGGDVFVRATVSVCVLFGIAKHKAAAVAATFVCISIMHSMRDILFSFVGHIQRVCSASRLPRFFLPIRIQRHCRSTQWKIPSTLWIFYVVCTIQSI